MLRVSGEQVLPLGKTLAWRTADERDRLTDFWAVIDAHVWDREVGIEAAS